MAEQRPIDKSIQNEIVELTCQLIRFKSMHSQPEEIQRCADFVSHYLDRHDIRHKRLSNGGVPSILVLPDERHAPVLLMSHIDVVHGPEESFEPLLDGDKLYGRGSIDDKYAAALSLVMVKNRLEQLRVLGKDQADLPLGILITGDEEIGGVNGARAALRDIRTDFGIALDGGNPEKIVVKAKGILKLKLISGGRAAHGSRPWLGENAIENLMTDYQAIKPLFPIQPDAGHWHKTMNISIIRAGDSFNQVPDHAEATLDIRYTENDDVDEIINAIGGRIKGDIEVLARESGFDSGRSPYLDLLLDLAPQVKSGSEHGGSDARYLTEFGFPGIVWGADGDMSQHMSDEHVNLGSVFDLYRILDEFVTRATARR